MNNKQHEQKRIEIIHSLAEMYASVFGTAQEHDMPLPDEQILRELADAIERAIVVIGSARHKLVCDLIPIMGTPSNKWGSTAFRKEVCNITRPIIATVIVFGDPIEGKGMAEISVVTPKKGGTYEQLDDDMLTADEKRAAHRVLTKAAVVIANSTVYVPLTARGEL